MDDLSSKLSQLLNDPDSMERVRQMAENILGGAGTGAPPPPPPENTAGSGEIGSILGSNELQGIISVISRLKSVGDDSRVKLIYALKPHLSEERQRRADNAVKVLKLLDALPLLKESGLLNLL